MVGFGKRTSDFYDLPWGKGILVSVAGLRENERKGWKRGGQQRVRERDFVPEDALKDCTLKNCFPSLDSSVQAVLGITSLFAAQSALRDRLLFIRRATTLYSCYPVCVVWLTCTHTHRNLLLCARESILFPFPPPSLLHPSLLPLHPSLFPTQLSFCILSYHIISYVHYFKSPASTYERKHAVLVFLMSYFDMMITSPIYFLANNLISCSSQLN